ncbi:hypothetical protein OH491_24955 [Termitidicoccus mucosus]|uniref:Uncharacterized protein n=1 Tax=Termitidicoccus mucosus TaxID=1184151 RepID=A0A178IQU3_9BACT|nr:hypothetical protein AW736_01585 [Opitutaceae bacterium TSB47]
MNSMNPQSPETARLVDDGNSITLRGNSVYFARVKAPPGIGAAPTSEPSVKPFGIGDTVRVKIPQDHHDEICLKYNDQTGVIVDIEAIDENGPEMLSVRFADGYRDGFDAGEFTLVSHGQPQDTSNVRFLLASSTMLNALREAENALEILAEAHEQETETTEAGGWATDALRVVRKALRDAEPPKGVMALFRVSANVVLVADGIEAYDTEAAQRYARESLEKARGDIDNTEVNLSFADGKKRDAIFSLPTEIEADVSLVDGEEGDPNGMMEHGVFEIKVAATVEFDVEASAGATPVEIINRAQSLLSKSEALRKSKRLVTLLCEYGKAKFGDEWWPGSPGAYLPGKDAAELETLVQ